MSLQYLKAPAGWSSPDKNPFTPDGSYGLQWSSFCILDRDDDQYLTGKSAHGPFSACFGRCVDHLENRLVDFLRYENAHGRTVILSFPEDMDVDRFVAQALSQTPNADSVRPNDPEVIIHSTTAAAWQRIRADGELKAASLLPPRPRLGDSLSEVECYLQNEPPEYDDYIMFGGLMGTGPEQVVASYQAGRFVLADDAVYRPGVRLYLDNHRIIGDGRGTRDGLHTMKVHKRLPLSPYLLAVISVDDIDPWGQVPEWTPRLFVEKANKVWASQCGSFRRENGG